MTPLLSDIKTAVVEALRAAGENPADYNVDAIVSPAPLLHGQIVRDYRWNIQDGARKKDTVQHLSVKYHRCEETIRTIIKRSRRCKT